MAKRPPPKFAGRKGSEIPANLPPAKRGSALVHTSKNGVRIARKHAEGAKTLEDLGVPWEQIQAALLASSDDRCKNFAYMLSDPVYKKYKPVEMLALSGVGLKDLAHAFQEVQMAQAKLQQMRHAPSILDTNAEAAIGRKLLCPTCGGNKKLFVPCEECKGTGKQGKQGRMKCETCAGTKKVAGPGCQTCQESGWVMTAGEGAAVQLFAESTGLKGAGKGPLVNINQSFGGGGGKFEDIMRDLEKAVPGPGAGPGTGPGQASARVIDAETAN